MIERKQYLDQLISKKENGMIKVITGVRRCGKSCLMQCIAEELRAEGSMKNTSSLST